MKDGYVFSTVLAALRSARSVNQSVIANEYKSSSSYISDFENGNRPDLNDKFLRVYSKVLNIPENEIYQLITHWGKRVSEMYAKATSSNEDVFLSWDYVRDVIRSEIRKTYYQDALEPRTRRTFDRNY